MTSFSSPTSSFDCAGEIEWLAKRTGLTEEEVKKRQETFQKQFPNGQVGKEEFREIASNLIDDSENDIDAFVDNVYRMFDLNQDRSLDFGEFVVATASAQSAIGEHGLGEEKPFDRMTWLFENVYDVDKSGKLTHGELEEVMVDLMKGEGLAFEANKALKNKARETVMDLFREMDADGDGLVTKEEFIAAAERSELLRSILCTAAKEREKEERKRRKKLSKGNTNCEQKYRKSTIN